MNVIGNIEKLFKDWYFTNAVSSICQNPNCKVKREELINYCKEHIEEFKQFAQETLEHPYEWCISIASLCDELLPNTFPLEHTLSFIEKMKKLSGMIKNHAYYQEWALFQPCNQWLNYFKGTYGIDYYKDYVMYKDYLNKHYIGWKPNEENDPNPTYEEYLNNKEKYQN